VRFLQAARIGACSLANDHVLDFEARGLPRISVSSPVA
jgi:hypothetical protein